MPKLYNKKAARPANKKEMQQYLWDCVSFNYNQCAMTADIPAGEFSMNYETEYEGFEVKESESERTQRKHYEKFYKGVK